MTSFLPRVIDVHKLGNACIPQWDFVFVCNRQDIIQYHGGLRSRELGQATMLLVFLTPRQALSTDGLTVLATG